MKTTIAITLDTENVKWLGTKTNNKSLFIDSIISDLKNKDKPKELNELELLIQQNKVKSEQAWVMWIQDKENKLKQDKEKVYEILRKEYIKALDNKDTKKAEEIKQNMKTLKLK